jgi:hypothetical protein
MNGASWLQLIVEYLYEQLIKLKIENNREPLVKSLFFYIRCARINRMKKQKLLVISNCQGPLLFKNLQSVSVAFSRRYQVMIAKQVQQLSAADTLSVLDLISEADIVCTQPLQSNPIKELNHQVLSNLLVNSGKRLITFPALHFDALFPGATKHLWQSNLDYPFGATEDILLAYCFVLGLSPQEARNVYHHMPFLTRQQLLSNISQNLDKFIERETAFNVDFTVSDFYREMWPTVRLHYVKSHPCPVVYREVMMRMGKVLELPDLKPENVGKQAANDQFYLPVRSWVKQQLDLSFVDDEDCAIVDRKAISFLTFIERLWTFYKDVGKNVVCDKLMLHKRDKEIEKTLKLNRQTADSFESLFGALDEGEPVIFPKSQKGKSSKTVVTTGLSSNKRLAVKKEKCAFTDLVKLKLPENVDSIPKSFVLKGIVLLKAGNPEGCQLFLADEKGEHLIDWGLASPNVAQRFPNNPLAASCRFKISGVKINEGEKAVLWLQLPNSERHKLATIGC